MKPTQVLRTSLREGTYIINGSIATVGSPQLVISNSDMALQQYDCRSLSHVRDINGHTKAITDLSCSGPLVASIQCDTGVMIFDLRMHEPVRFLTELQQEGLEGNTVDFSPSGEELAIGAGPAIHIVDVRMWSASHVLPEAHCDDVTKLRFVTPSMLVSGGEDQMINFYDIRLPDRDSLRCAVNCGEVMTRCNVMPDLGLVGAAGSCETAFLFRLPAADDEFPPEKTIRRGEQFGRYVVDWVPIGGKPFVLLGHNSAFDSDEASVAENAPQALYLRPIEPDPHAGDPDPLVLSPVHSDVVRVALILDAERMLTAGEDGLMAVWSLGASQEAVTGTAGNGSGSSDGARGGGRVRPMKVGLGATRPF